MPKVPAKASAKASKGLDELLGETPSKSGGKAKPKASSFDAFDNVGKK